MVYFGFMTNPLRDPLEELKNIRKNGFDFAELSVEQPGSLPEEIMKKRKEILNELKRFRHPPKAHAPYWADLGSMHDGIRNAWIAEGKEIIDVAARLDIQYLTFHSYSMGQSMKDRKHADVIIRNIIESLATLVEYGKKRKVAILVENMHGHRSVNQFEDFKRIVDSVPDILVTLDVGHAFIVGGLNNIKNYMRTFNEKIHHMHFHDNFGKEDDHINLGEGMINFKKVLAEMKKIKYDKTITIENHSGIDGAVKDMKFLKNLGA